MGAPSSAPWVRSRDPVRHFTVAVEVEAAGDLVVSWHAAMTAVRDHGRPSVDHLHKLVHRLGAERLRAGPDGTWLLDNLQTAAA